MIPDVTRQPWRGESAVVADRVLNGAIVNADISYGYEEYLEIVDRFYADDAEIGSDASSYSLRGKERVKAALRSILAPIHMMAEIAGLDVSMSESPIPGDSADVQHSEWSLELIGVSGRRVKATWCVRRRWKESLVVDEYHYDFNQVGEPLSIDDLHVAVAGNVGTLRAS